MSQRGASWLPAVALAVPAAVCVFAAAAVVVAGVTSGYRPMASPTDLTLSEAAALRDQAEVLRQIRRGADPNAPARVRPGFIRGSEDVITPLQAAVAQRRLETVRLLVEQGAIIDARNLPELWCFARRLEAADILTFLETRLGGAVAEVECSIVRESPW